jgi:hypothetical protein
MAANHVPLGVLEFWKYIHMKTIDELIDELQQFKSRLGGNTEVVFSFNGCTESGELLSITNVEIGGHFMSSDGNIYNMSGFVPNSGDKIEEVINIYSNREKYADKIRNKFQLTKNTM